MVENINISGPTPVEGPSGPEQPYLAKTYNTELPSKLSPSSSSAPTKAPDMPHGAQKFPGGLELNSKMEALGLLVSFNAINQKLRE